MATPDSTQKQREEQAFHILDTDAARLYTHIHPILVLSWYLSQFKSIVAEPVETLSYLLIPLGIQQAVYVVVCLPLTGSGSSPASTKSTPSLRKRALSVNEKISGGKRISAAILSFLLTLVAGSPLLFLCMILFGAPVTTHLTNTIVCAMHLALLSGLPLVYVHGVDGKKWRSIMALMLPMDEVFGAAVGTLFGAWLGAVPIPLDWDRDWQKWPITIITGAYFGWALGKITGAFLFKGKVIDLRG